MIMSCVYEGRKAWLGYVGATSSVPRGMNPLIIKLQYIHCSTFLARALKVTTKDHLKAFLYLLVLGDFVLIGRSICYFELLYSTLAV